MKRFKTIIIGIVSVFGAFLAACGSDSGSDADTGEVEEVKTVHGLGECKGSNEGVTKLVTSENKYYTCSNGRWDVSGSKIDTVQTEDDLTACLNKYEGDSAFVLSEMSVFRCQSGKWKNRGFRVGDYETKSKLPACKEKFDGLKGFVKEDSTVYLCDGKAWKAWADAYVSDEDLPNCSQNREGNVAWVLDGKLTLVCEDGSWTGDAKSEPKSSSSVSTKTDDLVQSSSGSDDGIVYKKNGTVKIDMENKSIVIIASENKDVCVNEGSAYTWKNVDFFADTSYGKYFYVGDTLVIINCEVINKNGEMEACNDYGSIWVGGLEGHLEGTWKFVPCTYQQENKISCNDKEYHKGDESTFTISGNTYSAKIVYDYNKIHNDDFDDYMNSRFMSKLYWNLAHGEASIPNAHYLTYEASADVEKFIKSAKIEVTKQTSTSVTFKFKEQTFSVDVKKLNRTMDGSEYYMVVSANNSSCEFKSEEGDVTKSTCKAEYGGFFDKGTQSDAVGNKIAIAYEYEKSNRQDFKRCTEAMLESVYTAIENNGGNFLSDDCEELSNSYTNCIIMNYEEANISNCSDIADEYADCAMYSHDDDEIDWGSP